MVSLESVKKTHPGSAAADLNRIVHRHTDIPLELVVQSEPIVCPRHTRQRCWGYDECSECFEFSHVRETLARSDRCPSTLIPEVCFRSTDISRSEFHATASIQPIATLLKPSLSE